MVRQELAAELGIVASLRTVERAVALQRRELEAEALATVRFETLPGRQLQIDFGECRVRIGDETVRVHLFVATLGYSRRVYVRAFRHERQAAWFDGAEVARHDPRRSRHERAVDAAHLRGIVAGAPGAEGVAPAVLPGADLLQPLLEYEQVAGGASGRRLARRTW